VYQKQDCNDFFLSFLNKYKQIKYEFTMTRTKNQYINVIFQSGLQDEFRYYLEEKILTSL